MAFRPTDYQSHGKKNKQSLVSFRIWLWILRCVQDHCPDVEVILVSSSHLFFTDSNCDASRVCWYLIESILPSAGEMLPIPLAATKTQSTTYTPLWSWRSLLFMNSSFFFCKIYLKHICVLPFLQSRRWLSLNIVLVFQTSTWSPPLPLAFIFLTNWAKSSLNAFLSAVPCF